MLAVDNQTPLSCLAFERRGRRDEIFQVVVLRGSFDLQRDEVVTPRPPQPPLCGDDYRPPLPPGRGLIPVNAVTTPSLHQASDLAPYKPATDVTVIGTARSAYRLPAAQWSVGLRLGRRLRKQIRVTGPRLWFRRLLGRWWLSDPYPVTQVPLAYELAFGGSYLVPARKPAPISVRHPDNPIGRGLVRRAWLRQQASSTPLLAPQIEDPRDPVTRPNAAHRAAGLGPLDRAWPTRLARAGRFDEHWQAHHRPFLPPDFDYRFFNAAPRDQQVDGYLAGNEVLTLWGLLPEGRFTTVLPALVPKAEVVNRRGTTVSLPLPLDTLTVDSDARTLSLVWRLTLPAHWPVCHATVHLGPTQSRVARPYTPPPPAPGRR